MIRNDERQAILELCQDCGVEPDEHLLSLPLDLATAELTNIVIERNHNRAAEERLEKLNGANH